MPSYTYMARDKNGLLQTGHVDAMDEDEVVAVLQNRGLIVTSLTRSDGKAAPPGRWRINRQLHGRVTTDDKVLFCQQLSTLVGAGIPLLKSLEVIGAQVESRALLVTIEMMRQEIEAGSTFRDAMAKHPKIFSSFWVNLVETGEASGHLSQSLTQLARYLESVREIQQKAWTAMVYPIVLISASVVALAVFLLKIVPMFKGVFASMNAQLPTLTQVIINVSNFLQTYVVVIVLGLAAAGYALRVFVRTERGRWLVDRVVLAVPVFNQLFVHLQLAQFARGLSALLESGVPILFGLEIMENSASNKVYSRAIGEVKDYIREGKTMAEPMERAGVFPPMVVQMVQVGEEIGELGKMLDRVAKYYEERVSMFIARMTALFEPIAIALMAVVIGVLVIGMFLPIFSLATATRVQ